MSERLTERQSLGKQMLMMRARFLAGTAITGVLALPISLRKADLKKAELALSEVSSVKHYQEFKIFYENIKAESGPVDWPEWANQYRNMLVHRGRTMSYHKIVPRDNIFYDHNDEPILRARSINFLARYPDRSDIESNLTGEKMGSVLTEEASLTLDGIFNSTRTFSEKISDRLIAIWKACRSEELVLEQPTKQWSKVPKDLQFIGYKPNSVDIEADSILTNPDVRHRFVAGALDDSHRNRWEDKTSPNKN